VLSALSVCNNAAAVCMQATGRGFVIEHENFLQGFKTYFSSHYV
jgi:hypothetical protein